MILSWNCLFFIFVDTFWSKKCSNELTKSRESNKLSYKDSLPTTIFLNCIKRCERPKEKSMHLKKKYYLLLLHNTFNSDCRNKKDSQCRSRDFNKAKKKQHLFKSMKNQVCLVFPFLFQSSYFFSLWSLWMFLISSHGEHPQKWKNEQTEGLKIPFQLKRKYFNVDKSDVSYIFL